MNTLTKFEAELLASIAPRYNISPGTLIIDETYSNTNTEIEKVLELELEYVSSHDENAGAQAPVIAAQVAALGRMKEDRGIPKTGSPGKVTSNPVAGFRRVSTNDYYTDISVQLGAIKTEGRYKRAKIYVSIKSETDRAFSIFFTGACTSSITEIKRGAVDNKPLLSIIDEFHSKNSLLIARLRYKPINGFITDFHRQNLKHALVTIYELDDQMVAELYLLGEYYIIPLSDELSKKQGEFYQATGMWSRDYKEFEGSDEMED